MRLNFGKKRLWFVVEKELLSIGVYHDILF